MKDDTTEQRVLFTELVDRPPHMQFDFLPTQGVGVAKVRLRRDTGTSLPASHDVSMIVHACFTSWSFD